MSGINTSYSAVSGYNNYTSSINYAPRVSKRLDAFMENEKFECFTLDDVLSKTGIRPIFANARDFYACVKNNADVRTAVSMIMEESYKAKGKNPEMSIEEMMRFGIASGLKR